MTENHYKNFLQNLKGYIEQSRLKAVLSVNRQMIQLYWEIGRFILNEQEKQGWGAKVIDRLSKDLRVLFPDMKGLSARNLKNMRKFAKVYTDFAIVQTLSAQIPNNANTVGTKPNQNDTKPKKVNHP